MIGRVVNTWEDKGGKLKSQLGDWEQKNPKQTKMKMKRK